MLPPRRKQPKTYLAQVDGLASPEALERLSKPLDLGDFVTQNSEAKLIQEPAWLWPRTRRSASA
jgi:23S rRNA pseudouridine2457 synthase